MKIERINKIKKHKIFRDFVWPPDIEDFKEYNLIYGWNWSGKTVLSNIFRSIEKQHSIKDGEVEITIGGHKISGKDFGNNGSLPNVKVFNRDFIKENVFAEHGSIFPIYFIGKESIEKQKKIEFLKSEHENKKIELNKKDEEKNRLEKELDNYCIEKGRAIKMFLSSSGSNPYNNYDKADFKRKCDELLLQGNAEEVKLEEHNKEQLKKKKEASTKEKVGKIVFEFEKIGALINYINTTISKTVVSQIIERLKDDQDLSFWVRDGLEKHKERSSDLCLFCYHPLPEGHLRHLEGHFNDEYAQLVDEIESMSQSLEMKLKAAEDITVPDKAKMYDHLVDEYEKKCNEFLAEIDTYKKFLNSLILKLGEKKKNPFKLLNLDLQQSFIDLQKLEDVNEVIEQHNKETDNFHATVSEARKKLEAAIVAESLEEYSNKMSKISEIKQALNVLETESRTIYEDIQALEREVIEHRKPAEELTRDLVSYLGHSELRFEVKDTGYQINRNDSVADDLSEGEKTAIAFLYFLKSLNDKNFDLNDGIVVIDDPVSSLDSNALFHVFGYMKERTKEAGQLIVLTHNFPFFRQVRNWFTHVNKRKKKFNKEAAFFHLESKSKNNQRISYLKKLDPLLLNYESEYHYLFKIVHECATQADPSSALDKYYHIPNVARRLLEAFLCFRKPSESELHTQLESIDFPTEKKTRIIRFLHTHSHNDHIDDLGHDVSILSETPPVLKDILDLIKTEDKKHYNDMISLVNSFKG